jgi:hypothetical protein
MFSPLAWLNRTTTGAELLAVLEYLLPAPALPLNPGPPPSALTRPCARCGLFPRMNYVNKVGEPAQGPYCATCQEINRRTPVWAGRSRNVMLVWGTVSRLPRQLPKREGFYAHKCLGLYPVDDQHFLMAFYKRDLKEWLQELVLYEGLGLTGLLQIFPTVGKYASVSMGDLLARIAWQETHASFGQLQVRFYAAPHHVVAPNKIERKGALAFEISDFPGLLETAEIFRVLLRPEQQTALRELLDLPIAAEAGFYWGRFLGQITPQAKDMLSAWRIRTWPAERVDLLYELTQFITIDTALWAQMMAGQAMAEAPETPPGTEAEELDW